VVSILHYLRRSAFSTALPGAGPRLSSDINIREGVIGWAGFASDPEIHVAMMNLIFTVTQTLTSPDHHFQANDNGFFALTNNPRSTPTRQHSDPTAAFSSPGASAKQHTPV
jgi:hypothetical protein